MSDAKAKAEARRAKILAREGSRLAFTKGNINTLNEEEDNENSEKSINGRPLATRRSLVKAEEPQNNSNEVPTKSEETSTDGETATRDSILTPKIVREIEKEIEENTKKFDEDTVTKDTTSSSKSSDSKQVISPRKSRKIIKKTPPIQANHVMQLIRVIAIGTAAVLTGYYTISDSSGSIVVPTKSFKNTHNIIPSTPLTNDTFDEDEGTHKLNDFLNKKKNNDNDEFSDKEFIYEESKSKSSSTSGPLGWIQGYLTRQLYSSISAVGLVWWITSMFGTAVNRMFPIQHKQNESVFNRLLALYNDGLSVVLEYVFKTCGEFSLHFILLLTTVIAFSYYQDTITATTTTTTTTTTTSITTTPATIVSQEL